MATQIGLYNAALAEIGEPALASVTENRAPRHHLDSVYSNVLADCLEAGDWNFAIREVSAAADTTVTENFGFTQTIGKPTDWVRTVALCSDQDFSNALSDAEYQDTVDFWAANITPLYVRYVSNGASYGLNLTAWPNAFRRFVELSLAERIVLLVNQSSGDKERLSERDVPRARRLALNRDARNEGVKYRRRSTWNDARGSGNRERGSRTNLIG